MSLLLHDSCIAGGLGTFACYQQVDAAVQQHALLLSNCVYCCLWFLCIRVQRGGAAALLVGYYNQLTQESTWTRPADLAWRQVPVNQMAQQSCSSGSTAVAVHASREL